MRKMILAWSLLSVLACISPGQNYHDEKYICGGYPWRCSYDMAAGLFVTGTDGSSSTLVVPRYYSYGYCMDVDNRKVVFTVCDCTSTSTCYQGPEAGIYCYDPGTQLLETLAGPDVMNLYYNYKIHVNQDGDFLFGNYQKAGSYVLHYRVMRLDRSGTLSTFLSSFQLGRKATFSHCITTDIDTGNILVGDQYSTTGFRFGVLSVSPDGSVVKTWSTGGGAGWFGLYAMPQEHATGDIVGVYGTSSASYLCRLRPGNTSRSTLVTVTYNGGPVPQQYDYNFDLQTAAQKRFAGTTWAYYSKYEQWYGFIPHDGTGKMIGGKVSGFESGKYAGYYDFAFYRGRHIQTVKTGPNRWDIRLSCPRSPNMSYVLAAGVSGVRPGIPLPDGRHINLNFDLITFMTQWNLLQPYWNPGSQKLDGNGEACGSLDLSGLSVPPGGFGFPLWVVLIVLDPAAPIGIKYLPDTYVMRI